MTLSTEQLKEELNKLYNEATMMGRLRTGSPITHMVDGALQLITQYGIDREIQGMRSAKSRVLRRTKIPKGAKNPTRDHVVVLGENIADIIDEDIAELQASLNTKGE